jgi:hypothetical protein
MSTIDPKRLAASGALAVVLFAAALIGLFVVGAAIAGHADLASPG